MRLLNFKSLLILSAVLTQGNEDRLLTLQNPHVLLGQVENTFKSTFFGLNFLSGLAKGEDFSRLSSPALLRYWWIQSFRKNQCIILWKLCKKKTCRLPIILKAKALVKLWCAAWYQALYGPKPGRNQVFAKHWATVLSRNWRTAHIWIFEGVARINQSATANSAQYFLSQVNRIRKSTRVCFSL